MSAQDFTEIWKSIEGHPGYEVSNFGRVRSPRGFIKPWYDNFGYPSVRMVSESGRKSNRTRIHRLVVEAFIGPIPPDKEVNHKNGFKQDPRLNNLEVITHRENLIHSIRVLKNPRPPIRAKLTPDDVRHIRALKGIVRPSRIALQFNMAACTISNIWAGRIWKHIT